MLQLIVCMASCCMYSYGLSVAYLGLALSEREVPGPIAGAASRGDSLSLSCWISYSLAFKRTYLLQDPSPDFGKCAIRASQEGDHRLRLLRKGGSPLGQYPLRALKGAPVALLHSSVAPR